MRISHIGDGFDTPISIHIDPNRATSDFYKYTVMNKELNKFLFSVGGNQRNIFR